MTGPRPDRSGRRLHRSEDNLGVVPPGIQPSNRQSTPPDVIPREAEEPETAITRTRPIPHPSLNTPHRRSGGSRDPGEGRGNHQTHHHARPHPSHRTPNRHPPPTVFPVKTGISNVPSLPHGLTNTVTPIPLPSSRAKPRDLRRSHRHHPRPLSPRLAPQPSCHPTTVSVDEDFRVVVVDAARFRVQVYRKTFKELTPGQIDPVDTYTDPKIN